ncbi:MAG TPA: NAD(P)-dependent oxidoreductase, partial [Lautropia sp.]|nr:NAD(P)-dependent oxidoreductase [Lautropia sp.]
MIIIDTALQKRASEGKPIRVGLVGAGFMARGVALQIIRSVPGMRVAAIANRTLAGARRAYEEAGVADAQEVGTVAQLEAAVASGRAAVTGDPLLLCRAGGIDAIVEVTGTIE